MGQAEGSAGDGRNETPAERSDRNFTEAVQELRVAQAGVQILFAFLLILAFTNGFPRDDTVMEVVLTASMLLAAGATVCFMAPVALHRMHFRQGRKDELVWATHWMAQVGLAMLLASMTLAIWLVLAYLWSAWAATVIASWFILGVAVVLFLLHLYIRRKAERR